MQTAFSALRAYVLSRQKLLGLLVFTLSLAPAVANLVSVATFLEVCGPTQTNDGLCGRSYMAIRSPERTSRRSDASGQTTQLPHSK